MQQQNFDVVVVGAGMGGLGAGALLSHWGYKTLVVEKQELVGGRCSSEEYEGFKLPTGAVAIHYKDTALDNIFQEVGAQLEFVDITRQFYRITSKDYEMPAKGSVSVLLDIISKLEEDRVKVLGGLAKAAAKEQIMTAFRGGTKEAGETAIGGPTFKEWLLQYTDSELTHAVFDTIISSLCNAHIYEISASAVFAFFVKMRGSREVGVAPRGSIVNMENLANVIRRNGDVWINCPATRFLIKGRQAKGVVVQKDGDEVEIPCQVVISDAGPKATVALAGEENFDEKYLSKMRLMLRPHSCTQTLIASDRPLWGESREKAALIIIGARRIRGVVPLSNICPELAPPGQHLLNVFGCAISNDIPMNVEEEQQQILLDLKEEFPLFEKHGRVLKMISRDINHELPTTRAWVGLGMPFETPIGNLYNVGDGCEAYGYGGTTKAAVTGRRVAETIRKRFRPGEA